MKIKVVIADDHPIFREGFKLVIKHLDNIECVGEATNGKELLKILNEKDTDIVFLDLKMPIMDGFEATEEIIKLNSHLKIIVLTYYDNLESVNKMIDMGVYGYMLKDADYEKVGQAVEAVMNDKYYFSNEIIVKLSQKSVIDREAQKKREELKFITEKEKLLLNLLCQGLSVKEIAKKMYVSDRTVEKYKERLMQKTNTNTTVKLVLFALKNNLANL